MEDRYVTVWVVVLLGAVLAMFAWRSSHDAMDYQGWPTDCYMAYQDKVQKVDCNIGI